MKIRLLLAALILVLAAPHATLAQAPQPAAPVKGPGKVTQMAEIAMEKGGIIKIEFFPDDAPKTVENFVTLAKKGFYNGLVFHRVEPGFVVQGGDPKGDGTGDAGYNIPDELSPKPYVRGTLGMPKTAVKDTGGCQIFFTHGRTPHLDGRYTVFGQIRRGAATIDLLDVGDKITKVTAKIEARIP